MEFARVSRRKSRIFFPPGPPFFFVVHDCLSKCPISKKTPLPQKTEGYASDVLCTFNLRPVPTGGLMFWKLKTTFFIFTFLIIFDGKNYLFIQIFSHLVIETENFTCALTYFHIFSNSIFRYGPFGNLGIGIGIGIRI